MSRLLRPFRATLLRPLPHPLTTAKPLSSSTTRHASSFQTGPSPPRLPADQQAEFERLQRAAEAALSSHTAVPSSAATPTGETPLSTSRHVSTPGQAQSHQTQSTQTIGAGAGPETGEAGTFSGGMRKGAPPEFEGDRHPTTGEVGGPKNEPLRWGSGGDWSFNGRVTDF